MKQDQVEIVGKVFVVVRGGRKCLICDGEFTRNEAAEHALTTCYPHTKESAVHNWKSMQ